MKWEEMKPRERDALVAEKVMGITVEHLTDPVFHSLDEDGNLVPYSLLTGYLMRGKFGYQPIPAYTTDMNAAWQVVTHLDIHLIVFEYQFFKRTDTYGDNVWLWQCRIIVDNKVVSSIAKSQTEALCKMVLKALEASERKESKDDER